MLKSSSRGVGHMVQWLRMHTPLAEQQRSVPSTLSRSSQLPVRPAPVYAAIVSKSLGTRTCVHIHDTHTHINKK